MSVKLYTPAVLYCGSFYDTTTQTNASGTSANLVSIGNTTVSKNVSVVSGSKVTFATSGDYLINFLGQFVTTGAGSNYAITLWAAKNGSNIADSSFTYTTSGVNGQVLGNLEMVLNVNSGDYVQFYWSSQNTYAELVSTAAGTSPTRPVSPSVNVTIFNVG
jgi:hypothetical protein